MSEEFIPQHREKLSLSLRLVMLCFSVYLLMVTSAIGGALYLGIENVILPLIILALVISVEIWGMYRRSYWASSLGLLIAIQILGSYIVAQFGGYVQGSVLLSILPAAVSLFIIIVLYREEYQFIY